ncbi:MAG TPA: hypothetical protein VE170_09215 [Candidatus Limnocylindria bacterium]|nr:hypothetical protein [Candidatus Limnocylindria bacterium]
MTAGIAATGCQSWRASQKISSPKLKKGLSEYAVLLRLPFNTVMGR